METVISTTVTGDKSMKNTQNATDQFEKEKQILQGQMEQLKVIRKKIESLQSRAQYDPEARQILSEVDAALKCQFPNLKEKLEKQLEEFKNDFKAIHTKRKHSDYWSDEELDNPRLSRKTRAPNKYRQSFV